ncbi:MAG: class I SAM-dependent methyltransferase [Salinimicrobium sediminis]|uniref:Methyltransferase domain-containing protein n=1 Tax=Salinimicrobium sediminis TaxID=1343891 RepID=A0A285XB20_9FLAO|nr:class I SAM-dependent methyltransferase [Salinimicrobium sediminis]MDX1602894.1 class I SAM-dependent methyltransferase [Salinimicrobium sediminis]MDX1754136.1 class I SAM-dependent methyltransferase [Salinimicrobium sediminis]SOC81629.1 Methyltransferase domain-containing protein [Salinimicrobium sediminis]
MTKNNKIKTPWPTKDAMAQIYKNNLWGGNKIEFYSGLGSHHPETVDEYIRVVSGFLKDLEIPPVVCDLGCGDFNIGKGLVKYTLRYTAVDIVPELIEHNKKQFQADHLEFHVLDIATDDLPKGDCAILRQVLQHLSNEEIKRVVEKLYDFKYVILTEHLPEGNFEPNKDIISGQGIRLKKQSGVDLLSSPFNLKIKEKIHLLSVPAPEFKGVLVTTLYKVK